MHSDIQESGEHISLFQNSFITFNLKQDETHDVQAMVWLSNNSIRSGHKQKGMQFIFHYSSNTPFNIKQIREQIFIFVLIHDRSDVPATVSFVCDF